ncbi:unnamed protein product [Brassica napus]|uniref:(rape) hypothetical protein n=1 Tax=Brassica napus TaxID=3708 RepID=A0A816IAG6_BRANA|nr:unnamed protein product [Brassica napus]
MEKREPSLVPEWLRSTGNGSSVGSKITFFHRLLAQILLCYLIIARVGPKPPMLIHLGLLFLIGLVPPIPGGGLQKMHIVTSMFKGAIEIKIGAGRAT